MTEREEIEQTKQQIKDLIDTVDNLRLLTYLKGFIKALISKSI